ncbi:hypothetical protein TNCV_302271 [Trichonephila clavipes]|nr:hypothetical protein TNCV_302271 [Trichonephila clavipes]
MKLLRLSRERNEAPIVAEALGPVVPYLKTSLLLVRVLIHHLLIIYVALRNNKSLVGESRNFELRSSENPTSFPEEGATMPYSGFDAELTRLHAQGHIHHTGWVAVGSCN